MGFSLKSVDFLTSSIYTETINNLRRKDKSQNEYH
nr:MAG TPA: Mistletoe Lectin I-inactivating protein, Mistletoe lectin, Viscum [Caudoviricetes sp.]